MEVASQLAQIGARERTVVVSTEQTAGRGRGGSVMARRGGERGLRHRHPAASGCAHRLSTLPLVAGVAIAEAIERVAACAAWLKWPNDVWLDVDGGFAKVAGVLVTTSLRGETIDHALVGIGVNVLDKAQSPPPRGDNDPGGHRSRP